MRCGGEAWPAGGGKGELAAEVGDPAGEAIMPVGKDEGPGGRC